jgi:hypothetical protein
LGFSAPELDLHEDVVAVALEGVEGDQGEALVGDRLLVDRLRVQLRGGRDRAADQGAAPYEGDGAGPPVLAAPAADHVVVQVDAPVRVVLGEDIGEVGGGAEAAGLVAGRLHVGDVAEQLQRALGAVGSCRAGHPDPPAPGALREPVELLRHLDSGWKVLQLRAGLPERLRQSLGKSPMRNPLLRAVGDETRDRARVRRHRRVTLLMRRTNAIRELEVPLR